MQLNSIFSKPVDRPIEGVIKADDESGLQIEVEEYVLTNEVSKHLNAFLEAYLEYQHANGAWVSGFFGSGKSHLLKMLAYILENRTVNSRSMLDYFLPKCADDEFLKGNLKRAAQIPSHSILFNIDQKADAISTNDTDAVLAVFVKVFNEMCGFYGKWGYLAQFERDMVQQGVYEPFQEAYQQLSGKTWASDRHLALAKKTQIARAYAQVTGSSQEHVKDIIKDYRDDYKLSIEDFAHMVKDYIDKQEPNFRLNFFVDEVGQYIAESTKLMTNLQTIAESLATICEGQAWIVVTSQEDMDKVIGNINRQQQHDFSKIMARFKMRLKLTSANVDEVIATRLLHKNAAGENALKGLHHQQKNNFGTFFDFSDSRTYRNFRNEQNFINLYPFIPYQFVLFQQALTNLSDHNAFEGRHAAIGERSMLGVFQTVAIQVKDQELGSLATFDRMFAGIRTMLKTQNQLSIQNAEQNLNDDFAVRVLKALFLVKYVKEFKATAHNVRILMTGGFDQNLGELKTKIEAALALLEQQTYIQRNGDEYEFLTNEEKDIEQEIKSTDIDPAETLDKLKEIIFDGIIRTPKIRHADSNQDFEFTKKVDQKIYGREHELTIQVISPEHEHAEDTAALTTMSMGLPQLIIALPTDPRLVSDLYLYCKTERFIQQATTNNQSESVMRIIGQKRVQNQNRLSGLQTSVRDLVAQAAYYVNGNCLEMNSQDASANIQTAFARLITSTYPHLAMLRGTQYQESDIWTYLNAAPNELFDQSAYENTEAQNELINEIQRAFQQEHRVTFYKMKEKFTHKPYGWSLAAIQCLLAMLHNRGRLEMRSDSNTLEGRACLEALKNTRGFPNVLLVPQIDFTARQIHDLRDFYNEFFDTPPAASDGSALGKETKAAFQTLADKLRNLLQQQEHYPFLQALNEPLQKLDELARQPFAFFLTDLHQQADDLLDTKESVIAPIRRFMAGKQISTYTECKTFLMREEANFTGLSGDKVNALRTSLDDPQCYSGNKMITARQQMESIRSEIQNQLAAERQRAQAEINQRRQSLQATDEYQHLNPDQQQQIDTEVERFVAGLDTLTVIASVRDSRRRFTEQVYPDLLTRITNMAHPRSLAESPETAETPQPPSAATISLHTIRPAASQHLLVDEAGVDAYLAQLKQALMEEIGKGNRISL